MLGEGTGEKGWAPPDRSGQYLASPEFRDLGKVSGWRS